MQRFGGNDIAAMIWDVVEDRVAATGETDDSAGDASEDDREGEASPA